MKDDVLNTFLTKYQLPLFFLITYLLSWWSVPFLNGGLVPQGPAFAAVIVTAIIAGRKGLRAFWKQLKNLGNGWACDQPAFGSHSCDITSNSTGGSNAGTVDLRWIMGGNRVERICAAKITS
ncbi:MAG: hypothetical protein P8Y72_18520 [Anaerolineales bacterium]